MSTETVRKVRCPICGEKTLSDHCTEPGVRCAWLACSTPVCQAILSPVRRIGHALDPEQNRDTKGAVRRLRYLFDGGEWRVQHYGM